MRNKFPRARSRALAPLLALAAALALAALQSAPLSSTVAARAQSGRRGTARTSAPATPEASSPESKESKESAAEEVAAKKPAVQVKLVVACRFDTKEKLRAAVICNNFVERLGESAPSVNSLGESKRDEARARAAREEPDAYLVFLQLEEDHVQEGSLVFNSSDLVVNYQIYAPGAREAKGKGKVYYQAMGGARQRQDRFPSGTPIKITPEAAGREAAEMVLDWFRIVEPTAGRAREN